MSEENSTEKNDAEKTGAERRILTRVPIRLRVNFRVMSPDEALDYVEEGNFEDLEIGASGAGPVGSLENETKDISLGGFSLGGDLTILGDKALERGTNLAVEILVPGQMLSVKAIAVVVWSKAGEGDEEGGRTEYGLMFKGISDKDLDRIKDIMDRMGKSL